MSDGTAIDYYAIWKIQQHSITLKGMGGTWSDGYDYRVYTADGGSKVEFSEEPSRDGYTFTGFYEQPNGEGTQLEIDDDGNITIPISEDTTWYADWQAGAGLLRFNANGGKFAPGEDDDPDDPPSEKDVEPSFGTYVNYPTPTREGYAFIGWVLDADSESETPVYTIQLTKDNNDKTYYAKWISSIAAVSFVATDADNADVCNVMRTGNFGSTFEIPADAQKAGYTFEGWFTKPNGSGAKLAEVAGETKKFSELDPYVYYAHFTNNNIKVTLEANNGTYSDGTASQEIAGRTDAEVHYSVPTRAGYTFVGWNKSGDATDTADAPCTSIAFPSENATYKACWTADSAKVTFIAAGAEVLENDATTGGAVKDYIGVTDGAVTYGTMTAKKDGYIFNGWSKTPDGAVVDPMPATFAPGNNTYYAVFTSEDVKVTFNANGGEIGGSDHKDITGKFDGAVDVEAPVREGYTFVGWANSPTAAIAEAKTDLTYGYDIAVNNAQLYAVWSANNMSVTYEANGGKFKVGEEEKDAVTLTGGAETTYTKPADPQREGYELASWNTLLNGKGTDVTNVDKFPTDKDKTYYAQWKKKKYKLTLDGNGGRVGSSTTAAMEGEFDNTVEYEVPTRAGYAFMGWAESGDEADANYQIRYNESTKDKTLKAVWKPASANVVFVAYGANEDVTTSIPGKVGEKFTVPADPARTGYIFDGWYTERDGGTRLDGEAGTEIEFASTTPAIYYAHFKDNKTTLTLHYNDGTTSAEDVTGIEGEIVPYKEVTRAGYTFKGWATKENPADKDLLGIQPVYPASAGSGMKIDWYAVWQQDQVTLTFSSQGGAFKDTGKEVATVDTVTDGAYALPTAPRRTGYTFDGWYTETNGQGERVPDAPTAPTSNAVYFAKWVGDQINLNLDPNGGGFSDSTSSAAEVASLDTNVITKSGEYLSQVSYELPKRAGYQFLGWNESGTAEEELVMSLSIPASEKTYKAVWEPHDITITYDAPEGKVVLSEGDNPSSKSDESVSFDGKTDNQVNFTVPTAEKEGYDFLGWTATAGSKEIASKPTNYPTQNATYYAAFRKEQITLKFDANGGTIYDKSSATYTDQYGFTVDYETPKRTGYYFTGWSTKEDGSTGTNLNYAYGKGDAVNGSTFYAQWSAFPEDLSKQLLDTKNELATAKAESSSNAQKVESANAEVERLTTENATLVEQSQGVVISGGGGNSTSEGGSGSDGAGSVQEKTRTVYTSGSDYGNTNAAASENNDEINIWNFWEQGPVYLVSFWIGFMVLSFVCAGLAFAFRKRWLKEHNLVDGLSKNSPNGGLKE